MKKLLAIIVGVVLLLIIGLFVYFNINNKETKPSNQNDNPVVEKKENKDIKVSDLSNTINYLEDGKIELSKFSLTNGNDAYYLAFTVKNNSSSNIDLTAYKIDILDQNDNKIVTINGNALGNIEAEKSTDNNISIGVDLSRADVIRFYK